MTHQQIQKLLFLALIAVSLSSFVYINGEAHELALAGFDVSYFSSDDTETLFPDTRLLGHILDKLREAVFVR